MARRLPWFALAWLASIGVWVLALGYVSPAAIGPALATLGVQAAALGAAAALARRARKTGWLRGLILTTCASLGLSSIALFVRIDGVGEVLAFVLLSLYLATALVFAWGWSRELILLATTLVPFTLTFPLFAFFVPPAELAAAVGIGAILALAIAEGHARSARAMVERQEREHAALAALVASRDAYRVLAEEARDMIWAADLDGRVTYVNDACLRYLGRARDAVVGHPVRAMLTDHPENPDVAAVLRDAARGTAPPLGRWQCHRGGGVGWVETAVAVTRGLGDLPAGVHGIGRDVSEQVAAEELLRESEERFRRVFDDAAVGMAVVAMDGRTVQVNRALCQILGYEERELLARPIDALGHPNDVGAVWHEAGRLVSGEAPAFTMHKRYLHKDGHVVWARLHCSLIRDRAGAPQFLVSQIEDVTARTRAEARLRETEERYRAIVESNGSLLMRFDRDGVVAFVNDVFCRVHGVEREDVVGRSFLPVVHPDDVATVLHQIAILEQPPHRARTIARGRTPRGWRWFEFEGSATLDAGGRLHEIQAIGRDVTERIATEEALRRSLAELCTREEQLRLLALRQVAIREEERKRLGFELHDDVCQELVGIGILVESARRRIAAGGARDDLAKVVRYLQRVGEHLRGLAHDLRPLQLPDLGLVGSLRALAGGLGSDATTITVAAGSTIPRLDEDVEVGVFRVAQEALTNALRHAGARTVTMTLSRRKRRLVLEVLDDGCGFDTTAPRTTALGLVAMEERAMALAGALVVESEPGAGTTVRLECPLRAHRAEAGNGARRLRASG